MTGYGYTYEVGSFDGMARIDVCDDCRKALGLPKTSLYYISVKSHRSRVFRDDPCLGCGGPATSFGRKFGRAFDGDEEIVDGYVTARDAKALSELLNKAENLDVFASTVSSSEEVPVGEGAALVSRSAEDAERGLHLIVENDEGDSRVQMEARCERLNRLLALNGWDGAARPNPIDENDDTPDWEIYAVEA